MFLIRVNYQLLRSQQHAKSFSSLRQLDGAKAMVHAQPNGDHLSQFGNSPQRLGLEYKCPDKLGYVYTAQTDQRAQDHLQCSGLPGRVPARKLI